MVVIAVGDGGLPSQSIGPEVQVLGCPIIVPLLFALSKRRSSHHSRAKFLEFCVMRRSSFLFSVPPLHLFSQRQSLATNHYFSPAVVRLLGQCCARAVELRALRIGHQPL